MATQTRKDPEQDPAEQIYVVEDHPLIQRMVEEILNRSTDLTVCGFAATAAEALEKLRATTVDLVLVDISLPDMSGIELVGILLAENPKLPCLMLSGHQEIKYIQQALAAGARGYLAKGNPRELTGAIRQVLQGGLYLSEPVRSQLHEAQALSSMTGTAQ
jgi:DNA-binding NarL/FixJ family response regulator